MTSERLADDVYELVVSLGYRCRSHHEAGQGSHRGDLDLLHPQLLDDRRRLPAAPQAAGCTRSERPATTARDRPALHHVDVRPVASPCPCAASRSTTTTICISPAASMIPTHNSTLALDLCRAASIHNNLTSVLLQPGDDALRDHHAAAVGRGEGAAQPHPQRQACSDDDWTKLARKMGEVSSGADVHRRLAQHDDDGDPGQGAPAQAAPRPAADRHRLHAADDLGQEGRVPPARGLGVLPPDQAAGQGARGPDHRALPAQPWPRAALATSARC